MKIEAQGELTSGLFTLEVYHFNYEAGTEIEKQINFTPAKSQLLQKITE